MLYILTALPTLELYRPILSVIRIRLCINYKLQITDADWQQGHRQFLVWKSKIPTLRVKIPENSRYLIPHIYTLSDNRNLTTSHYLSIAMSDVNSLSQAVAFKSTSSAMYTSRRPTAAPKQIIQSDSDSDCLDLLLWRITLAAQRGHGLSLIVTSIISLRVPGNHLCVFDRHNKCW